LILALWPWDELRNVRAAILRPSVYKIRCLAPTRGDQDGFEYPWLLRFGLLFAAACRLRG